MSACNASGHREIPFSPATGWRVHAQAFTFGRIFEAAYLLAAAVVAKEYFSKGNVSTEELSAKLKGEADAIENKPVAIAYGAKPKPRPATILQHCSPARLPND
jgi:hypothetical protein